MYKYRFTILAVGCTLIWSIYFSVRTVKYSSMETARGQVTRMMWGDFIITSPRHTVGGGPTHADYPCPEVHFCLKENGNTAESCYTTSNEAYSEYPTGTDLQVIFPKGDPTKARIYSFSEYWLPTPSLILLAGGTLLWCLILFVVFFLLRNPFEKL